MQLFDQGVCVGGYILTDPLGLTPLVSDMSQEASIPQPHPIPDQYVIGTRYRPHSAVSLGETRTWITTTVSYGGPDTRLGDEIVKGIFQLIMLIPMCFTTALCVRAPWGVDDVRILQTLFKVLHVSLRLFSTMGLIGVAGHGVPPSRPNIAAGKLCLSGSYIMRFWRVMVRPNLITLYLPAEDQNVSDQVLASNRKLLQVCREFAGQVVVERVTV